MEYTLSNIVIVGDRVLIKPLTQAERTGSGLFLPPGVQEKEKVHTGYVMKTGPGFALPHFGEEEQWKKNEEQVKYLPLQAKPGDLALYLQKDAVEIVYKKEKYIIIPHSSILLLEREDLL